MVRNDVKLSRFYERLRNNSKPKCECIWHVADLETERAYAKRDSYVMPALEAPRSAMGGAADRQTNADLDIEHESQAEVRGM